MGFELILISVFIFIVGACVGSFLNVCIVRMPKDISVVRPSSHCFQCQKPVAWFDNIPLISYWVLQGKCRHCGAKFSLRYFFIELLTAIIFTIFYYIFGFNLVLIPYLFMISCFIVATMVDFEHRIIPDQISIGGMVFGLLFSCLIPPLHGLNFPADPWISQLIMALVLATIICAIFVFLPWGFSLLFPKKITERFDVDLWFFLLLMWGIKSLSGNFMLHLDLPGRMNFFVKHEQWLIPFVNIFSPVLDLTIMGSQNNDFLRSFGYSLNGAVIGGFVIYAMGLLGELMFKKEAMGGGDVKLLAMMGAFLGWPKAVLTFFIAPLFGAIFGVIEKIRTKQSEIPYGPFLVLGAMISLFYGNKLIAWILNGYGF